MDDVDFAQEQQTRLQDLFSGRAAPRAARRPSSFFCKDCSDPIPEARRAAVEGCERCVHCQAELEGAL